MDAVDMFSMYELKRPLKAVDMFMYNWVESLLLMNFLLPRRDGSADVSKVTLL